MHKLENLTVGWIDTNIRAVVEAKLLSQFSWVLITSIDSIIDMTADTSTVKDEIARIEPRCAFLGSGLVVPAASMVSLANDQNLFTGFDELWVFNRYPDIPKPDDLWIVAPFNIDNDPIPSRLVSWMVDADCQLGLGDGIGLNYATPSEKIAGLLERLSD